jgi:hypothetical protein
MILLAIDPGPTKSAYVLWDTEKHDFVRDDDGKSVIGLAENHFVMGFVHEICTPHQGVRFPLPELVAIETPQNYGNQMGRETLETLIFVGRLIEIVYRLQSTTTKLYARPSIKGQVGGRNDSEIRSSLIMRYGASRKGEKLEGVKNDIWAALALAVALEENAKLKEW